MTVAYQESLRNVAKLLKIFDKSNVLLQRTLN